MHLGILPRCIVGGLAAVSAVRVSANPPKRLVARDIDLEPGFGPELETSAIQLKAEKECSLADTNALKGTPIENVNGLNWTLTGDSTPIVPGLLNVEIIGDGLKIKLGTGAVEQTMRDIKAKMYAYSSDLQRLRGQKVQIRGSKCGDWIFEVQDSKFDGGDVKVENLKFEAHFTLPLPLEAIHDIFLAAATNQNTPFLVGHNPDQMLAVAKDFFQTSPNGIEEDDVTKDVMCFFSMILSYAKGTGKIAQDSSPKHITQVMPRTDFTTLLTTIENFDPEPMFPLVEILACYEKTGSFTFTDDFYCDGDEEEPIPNGKLRTDKFSSRSSRAERELPVQQWLENLHCYDLLSRLDQIVFAKQLGGRGDRLEYLFGTTRKVGIYEIRGPFIVTFDQAIDLALELEKATLTYHGTYAVSPR